MKYDVLKELNEETVDYSIYNTASKKYCTDYICECQTDDKGKIIRDEKTNKIIEFTSLIFKDLDEDMVFENELYEQVPITFNSPESTIDWIKYFISNERAENYKDNVFRFSETTLNDLKFCVILKTTITKKFEKEANIDIDSML
jgi:hypothetical protein